MKLRKRQQRNTKSGILIKLLHMLIIARSIIYMTAFFCLSSHNVDQKANCFKSIKIDNGISQTCFSPKSLKTIEKTIKKNVHYKSYSKRLLLSRMDETSVKDSCFGLYFIGSESKKYSWRLLAPLIKLEDHFLINLSYYQGKAVNNDTTEFNLKFEELQDQLARKFGQEELAPLLKTFKFGLQLEPTVPIHWK